MPTLPIKTRFIIKLVRCLHQYGASTYRLEGAVNSVTRDLKLNCDLFSGPTSCLLSITDEEDEDESHTITRVLRLEPGVINLSRLSRADEIADRVTAGTLTPEEGSQQLDEISQNLPEYPHWQQIVAYTIASGAVATLLESTWGDILAASVAGLFIGILSCFPGNLSRQGSLEAVAAMIAAMVAVASTNLLPGISRQVVVVAGLIVLLPGLSLTTAMAELATNHLVSGSARLAGATMTLLKLTFGVVLGSYLAELVFKTPLAGSRLALPIWLQWMGLLLSSWAFAHLFHVRKRDLPAALMAAILGYLLARITTEKLGADFGIFVAGLFVAALSNLFARIARRPASIVRLPGIILLVPGSMGFRGVTAVFEKEALQGLDTGFSLVVALAALVAGLLFGNALLPPRRSL